MTVGAGDFLRARMNPPDLLKALECCGTWTMSESHDWKTFSSSGREGVGSGKRSNVELSPGILIVRADHHGDGEFKVDFVRSRFFNRQIVRAARMVSGAAFAVVAGFLVDIALGCFTSAQYVLQLATGVSTALLALAAQPLLSKLFEATVWCPSEGVGTIMQWAVVQVKKGDNRAIPPGKYRLEVQSTGDWLCKFKQPGPGEIMHWQANDTMTASEPQVYGSLVLCPVQT